MTFMGRDDRLTTGVETEHQSPRTTRTAPLNSSSSLLYIEEIYNNERKKEGKRNNPCKGKEKKDEPV